MNFVALSLALITGCVVCLQSASATLSAVYTDSTNGSAYMTDIQTTDLVNSGQATLLSASASLAVTGFNVSGLNDGIGDLLGGTHEAFWNVAPVDITFNLNTNSLSGGSSTGYDISQIQSIMAWTGSNFCNQTYTISVEPVGSSSFTLISGTFTDPSYVHGNDLGQNKASKSIVTDSTGTIASGVQAVRLTYSMSYGDQGIVIQEIDVNGAATAIPEPTACALLAVGAVFLARRRQRA